MQKTNILIVEDEALVALDIEECLLNLGYNVAAKVGSGEEAISTAKKVQPDLILMDIMLQGGIDGIEAASAIRSEIAKPVIFLTAHADQATLDRAKITEPYGYVLKPFKEMELKTVIELALHRHKTEKREAGSGQAIPDFESMVGNDMRSSQSDQVAIRKFLKTIEPFTNVADELIEAVSKVCRYGLYPSNALIAVEGETSPQGFVVVYGRVSLVKSSVNGKELIVEFIPPSDPFGLLSAIETGPYPFTARAQTDSRILWIPRAVISYLLDHFPDLTREYISKVLERLRKAHDLSRALAHDLVEVRIASALLALLPRYCSLSRDDDSYHIKLTRQELAEMTGTSPETVSRSVKTMERDGLLDLSETGKVKILDSGGLEKLLESQA